MASARGGGPPSAGPTVYIGPRPTMHYVFEVVAQLYSGASPVVVKARGLAIGKAVDVVEVVRHKFLAGSVEVGPIRIDTENLVNRTGRETRVSSIAIPLSPSGPLPPRGPEPAGGGGGPTSPRGSPRPAGAPS